MVSTIYLAFSSTHSLYSTFIRAVNIWNMYHTAAQAYTTGGYYLMDKDAQKHAGKDVSFILNIISAYGISDVISCIYNVISTSAPDWLPYCMPDWLTNYISDLAAGTYTCTITDANGCVNNSYSVVVNQPPVFPSTIMYVNESATGNNSGDSWANAYTDLRYALFVAQCSSSAINQIWLAKGTYKPSDSNRSFTFNIPRDLKIYGGFAGTETAISQRNIGSNPTILSGNIGDVNSNADNSYRVVKVYGGTQTLLDGLIIEDANNQNVTISSNLFGAGLLNDATGAFSSELTINNCVFRNNLGRYGGAICNDGRSNSNTSKINIYNTVIYNNSTAGFNQGAAIANYGNVAANAIVKMVNSTVVSNVTDLDATIFKNANSLNLLARVSNLNSVT